MIIQQISIIVPVREKGLLIATQAIDCSVVL